ncbi:hypothetical protein [Segnochrobactrum spirostomi]|uniref:Sulfur globule protein n=1 Tax=Segnochrobactrum spirostomi TaxID=2608987 RepID=A0A6A7Y402_9HYPH|nr:hypothetical protein [Segnochrobactrum spirostomi]MQT12841.1 hypothetical protein [Segnochrobactrum spirostomi]
MPKTLSVPRALVFAAAVLGTALAAIGPAAAQWDGYYGGRPAPGYGAPPPPPPPGWQRGPSAGPPGWQGGPYVGPRGPHRVCRTHYQRVVVRRPYAPPLVTMQPVRDCRWVR